MQIIFTADNTFFAKLIRYCTKRSWLRSARTSHTMLKLSEPDQNWLIQTNEKGLHLDWWHKVQQQAKIVFMFDVLNVNETAFNECLDEIFDEFVWKTFDVFGMVGMLVVCVWYCLTKKKIKNPFGQSTALICSEAIYRLFKKLEQKTGVKYFNDEDVETIFPEELLIECLENPALYRLVK